MFSGKLIITFLFILIPIAILFSQDSTWNKKIIDENLTISFPGEVDEFDTTIFKEEKKWRIKVYKYETGMSAYGLIVTPGETNIHVDNKESWKEALKGMSKGAMKTFMDKGFSCAPSDSTIDEIPCVKLICKNKEGLFVKQYLFLVNDKLYALQYSNLSSTKVSLEADQINTFLKSVHFKKEGIKEMQFESKAFSYGYKFGELIGYLIIPAIIVVLVLVVVKRKNS